MRTTRTKRVVKPKVVKSKYAKYIRETLDAMTIEELCDLGAEVKDNPKEKTLFVAIVTVLGSKGVFDPKF